MQRERDCDWSQRLVSDRVCVSERVCGRECVGESVWERVCGRECVGESVWESANTAVCISNSNSPVGGRGRLWERSEREREREMYYWSERGKGMCWRGGWQIRSVSVFSSKLFLNS